MSGKIRVLMCLVVLMSGGLCGVRGLPGLSASHGLGGATATAQSASDMVGRSQPQSASDPVSQPQSATVTVSHSHRQSASPDRHRGKWSGLEIHDSKCDFFFVWLSFLLVQVGIYAGPPG